MWVELRVWDMSLLFSWRIGLPKCHRSSESSSSSSIYLRLETSILTLTAVLAHIVFSPWLQPTSRIILLINRPLYPQLSFKFWNGMERISIIWAMLFGWEKLGPVLCMRNNLRHVYKMEKEVFCDWWTRSPTKWWTAVVMNTVISRQNLEEYGHNLTIYSWALMIT